MEDKIKLLIQTFGEHRIKLNEPLSNHIFFKSSGVAKAFFIATNSKELKEVLDAALDLKMPFLVIGSGTKTYFSSAGFKGLVIKNRTPGLKIGAVKGKVGRDGIGVEEAAIEVDSGVSLGKLNEFLVTQNLQPLIGVTNVSTIGGAIWTTPALIEVTQKVTVWEKGEIREVEIKELKRTEHVILSVILKIRAAS